MAEEDRFLTGSIDDYLLGLADGVQKAQRQLSQMAPVVQPGEAPVTYQIPRVDFELKLSFEMTLAPGADPDGQKLLRFRPPGAPGAQGTAEAASTIRGALVAVPLRGGKPPPLLRTTLRRIDGRKLEVTALLSSAAGERLAGIDVQFNVDRELSRKLTPLPNSKFASGTFEASAYEQSSFDQPSDLHEGTAFWDGLVTTDAQGIAVGVLNVDRAEPPGTYVASVVDALGQTEVVLFKVE
jgi:hypothetical protein